MWTQEGMKHGAIVALFHHPHDVTQVIQNHVPSENLWIEQKKSGVADVE